MDYLLREIHILLGSNMGCMIWRKLLNHVGHTSEKDGSYLAISDEGIYALEQLLLAKLHMTQQVYRHRVRSISDAMIVRGIELAICKGNQELEATLPIRWNIRVH